MEVGLALAIALVACGFARLWQEPKAWARISPRLQCGGQIWYESQFVAVSQVFVLSLTLSNETFNCPRRESELIECHSLIFPCLR